jgi:hypothetical protein
MLKLSIRNNFSGVCGDSKEKTFVVLEDGSGNQMCLLAKNEPSGCLPVAILNVCDMILMKDFLNERIEEINNVKNADL